MKIKRRSHLKKKASHGFRGYPIATICFYGPDDTRASKVAIGVVKTEEEESPSAMHRLLLDEGDARTDPAVAAEIARLVKVYGAKSVTMTDRIIGCPHEEGKDYPDGEVCPQCPFWANRDRWTGELLQ